MALTSCPECAGRISDQAPLCPHCGFPLKQAVLLPRQSRRTPKRRPNGSGSVVKLSGKRRNPYQVRVNTRIDGRGYPAFDVLGDYANRVSANIALAEYNKDPYDPSILFREVYEDWYRWKYRTSPFDKGRKTSSQYCVIAAYKKCSDLYDMRMLDIRPTDMQVILDREDLSHSMAEHVKNLFNQLYQYAMQFDLIRKNYAPFIKISKEDDTEAGVPFTEEKLALLWQNTDKSFVDTVLIYCYSGWRINELAGMPLSQIDLEARTFTGGLKTRYSRNRIVPIHSKIYDMVAARYDTRFKSLIYHDGTSNISEQKYRRFFTQALRACGIQEEHTPHDCRHTFNTLLDKAGVDRVSRYKLMGHSGQDINEQVYTHKDVNQLREAIEMIKI